MPELIVVFQPKGQGNILNCGDIYGSIKKAKAYLHRITLPARKPQQAWVIALHSWDPNTGSFSGKARYHIDRRDLTDAPIRNCGELINAAQSGVI